jgi:hypothetical protein
MQNSFSLGLLHGALYGITPLTPWFIGLKRYVFEGQAKGLLTFAGLFLGQVGLLLVAFFGGTELLWIWYYLEPALMLCGMIAVVNAMFLCWKPCELPTQLTSRKEAGLYLLTGVFFALCNPNGLMFGDSLLTTLPENNFAYLGGFILLYTSLSVGLVYITCLSPLGQKAFGAWSIERMLNFTEPSLDFFAIRLRNVQILSIATLFVLFLQLFQLFPDSFTTYYVDTMFGATPAKGIMPKRDLHWIESSEEATDDADSEGENGTVKVWKLQSKANLNRVFETDPKLPLDETSPWNIVYKYNSLNERLERNEISNERKELEVEYYEERGLDTYLNKWLHHPKLRFMFKPDWDTHEDMKASLLEQLTEIRFQMDDILRMQYATQYNEARPHLPFNIDYEFDYDFDAEKLAKDDMGITEEVVQDLKTLKTNPDVQATGFFNQTYEMVHRGSEFMDFSIVKLQDLPQEVSFPWDYPVVHAPNVPEISAGIQEANETDVARRNDVQNKNVWFLDPIALNTRFLANDPLPATHDRWVDSDILELRAPNTTRRWWLGDDLATEEGVNFPTRSARETLMGKGGLRR